jgi:hypothetical protein
VVKAARKKKKKKKRKKKKKAMKPSPRTDKDNSAGRGDTDDKRSNEKDCDDEPHGDQ